MEKKNKPYESPDVMVTHVEVEASICGGSADITNIHEGEHLAIESQKVNNEFGYTTDPGSSSLGGWDEISNGVGQ